MGEPGLVRRVPEAVQTAVEGTIAGSGRAGERLAKAWGDVFGIAPNPSQAYSLAIKAVEDAAKSVVSPNDTSATLGKMISVMAQQKGWSLPLQRDDKNVTSGETVLSMMRMLWAGQVDRHGGDPNHSVPVAQEAAEAAVLTAVTLVQWFTSGAVARQQP